MRPPVAPAAVSAPPIARSGTGRSPPCPAPSRATSKSRSSVSPAAAAANPAADARAAPAGGVGPGGEDRAEVIGVERRCDAADRGKRAQPRIGLAARDAEALSDKRAVDPDKRHDIAHRAERDEVEPMQEIGLGPRGVPADFAQRAVERDD